MKRVAERSGAAMVSATAAAAAALQMTGRAGALATRRGGGGFADTYGARQGQAARCRLWVSTYPPCNDTFLAACVCSPLSRACVRPATDAEEADGSLLPWPGS